MSSGPSGSGPSGSGPSGSGPSGSGPSGSGPSGSGPCVIVPVKRLGEAKSRLGAVLAPEARAELVLAMLEDVLTAARAAHDGPLLVVTPDADYAASAARAGAELLADAGGGYNAALTQALGSATALEAGSALVLPADQARAQPSELRLAIEALERAEVVVAPSRDGGTGLLGLRPPRVIAPAFGLGSGARHRALGESAGRRVEWLELPSLRDDIDTVDDLLREGVPLGVATAAFVSDHASLLEGASWAGA